MEIPDNREHRIVNRDPGVLELSFKQLNFMKFLVLFSYPCMALGIVFLLLAMQDPGLTNFIGMATGFMFGIPFFAWSLVFPVAKRVRIDEKEQTLTIMEFRLLFGQFTKRFREKLHDLHQIQFCIIIDSGKVANSVVYIGSYRLVSTNRVHQLAMLAKDVDDFIDGKVPFSIEIRDVSEHGGTATGNRCFTIATRFSAIESVLFSTLLYKDNECIMDRKNASGFTYTCPNCERKYCSECAARMQAEGNPRCVLCGAPIELAQKELPGS
nr:hypothetical protein [Candidatus Sigynarchaeota archaeon]